MIVQPVGKKLKSCLLEKTGERAFEVLQELSGKIRERYHLI